jgi:hypothetical protein
LLKKKDEKCSSFNCFRQRILTDTAHASVVFNSKNPTWQFDELRVHLPSRLTEKHHLMIFFSEVDVQAVRKSASSSSSEVLVGVSVIPLLNASGALVDSSGQGFTFSPFFLCLFLTNRRCYSFSSCHILCGASSSWILGSCRTGNSSSH